MYSFVEVSKRSLPHFGLLAALVVYVLVGAGVFYAIENTASARTISQARLALEDALERDAADLRRACLNREEPMDLWNSRLRQHVMDVVHRLEREGLTLENIRGDNTTGERWDYGRSVLFSFMAVTTIGYGNMIPQTIAGKLICIIYTMVGVPLTLITIANLGKFLAASAYLLLHNRGKSFRCGLNDTAISCSFVLTCAALYIIAGACCVCVWEGHDFVTALYYTFMTLFTIGPDDRVLRSTTYLFAVILYIIFGLMVMSLLLSMVAVVIRKVHYREDETVAPDSVGQVPIWFGPKRIPTAELAAAIGKYCDLDDPEVGQLILDLDDIVLNTLAQHDGRPNTAEDLALRYRPLYGGRSYGMLFSIAQESIAFFDDRTSVASWSSNVRRA